MGNLTSSFGGHAGYNTELRSQPSVVGGRRENSDAGTRSEVKGPKSNARTFYKSDDESSLELGLSPAKNGSGVVVGTGSEENLTTREMESRAGDIHVHTLVEVTSGKHVRL